MARSFKVAHDFYGTKETARHPLLAFAFVHLRLRNAHFTVETHICIIGHNLGLIF